MSTPSKISAPTITELTVRTVVVPMQIPHTTASGVITESPLILIDVTTSDGVTGHGLLFTYTVLALAPIADFISNIAPLVIGQTLAPAELSKQLHERFRLIGTQGTIGMALAGIDMALWDTLARTQELPLVSLLGGVEKPILAYGAVGFDGVKGCAEQAEAWAKRGFKGIKAKIGYATVKEDIKVIDAMRAAAGQDIAIMVDYNQSLTPTDAIERIKVLDSVGLTWVEEPTLAHDYSGHAAITQATKTPIQCGENWWHILDVRHALDAKASDYIMLDVMKVGGVTGWMKAAALAEVAGVSVSSHLWSELSARLLSCSATANWLEYCEWWNPILQNPLTVENGYTKLESTVGSGIEWNEKKVEEYLV